MKIHWKNVKVSLLVAMAVFVIAAGVVFAQQQIAATDSGIFETQPSAGVSGEPDGAVTAPNSAGDAPAGSDTGIYDSNNNSLLDGPPPDDNPNPGGATSSKSLSPSAVSQTFSYYQVSGATLRGRSSITGYAYDGSGCVHVTAGTGTNMILNTELNIPDGSVIKYLRLYYKDSSATGYVRGYLTRYTPGSTTTDLLNVASTAAFSGGNGFVVSTELTETVNNTVYAYTLIGWPTGADFNLQVCGLRIAYYAPVFWATFVPAVSR